MSELKKTIQQYEDWYSLKRPIYEMLTQRVKEIMTHICEVEKINYQNIEARTKSVESFVEKIKEGANFNPEEMQDLAGIQIVVFVNSDVDKVSELIRKCFLIDETRSIDKGKILGINKVGYKSVHFVVKLPEERIKLAEYKQFGNLYFEIQVRTILQHAWAQIGHDRHYKFTGVLPTEIKRRFSLLAGLLEIADNEFNVISKEVDSYEKDVSGKTRAGNLDISINSTSLRQYLKEKFGSITRIEPTFGPADNMASVIIKELHSMNIERLSDLEKIIRKEYKEYLEDFLEETKKTTNFCGIVRDILIISDPETYFEKAWKRHWVASSSTKAKGEIFDKFGINFNKLIEKYRLL